MGKPPVNYREIQGVSPKFQTRKRSRSRRKRRVHHLAREGDTPKGPDVDRSQPSDPLWITESMALISPRIYSLGPSRQLLPWPFGFLFLVFAKSLSPSNPLRFPFPSFCRARNQPSNQPWTWRSEESVAFDWGKLLPVHGVSPHQRRIFLSLFMSLCLFFGWFGDVLEEKNGRLILCRNQFDFFLLLCAFYFSFPPLFLSSTLPKN